MRCEYCEAAVYITTASDKAQKTLDFSSDDGRIVFVGAGNVQNSLTVSLQSIAQKRLSIKGVSGGEGFFTRAINMLANKAADVAPLITRTIGFDEIPAFFKQMSESPLQNIVVNVKI